VQWLVGVLVQEDGGILKKAGERISAAARDWTPLAMIRYLESVLKVRVSAGARGEGVPMVCPHSSLFGLWLSVCARAHSARRRVRPGCACGCPRGDCGVCLQASVISSRCLPAGVCAQGVLAGRG